VADLNRALLVVKGRHQVNQFLEEQVARGEQQIQQDQRLADAHHERSGPVKDGTGAMASFELHRGRFLLFPPVFSSSVAPRLVTAAAAWLKCAQPRGTFFCAR